MSDQTQTNTDTSNTQLQAQDTIRPMATPWQETVLTAAAFCQEGSSIVGMVSPDDFGTPYDNIARRLWGYWEQNKQPPGRAHLDDIFADSLTGDSAPQYRRLLFA